MTNSTFYQVVEFHQYKPMDLFPYLSGSGTKDDHELSSIPTSFSCDIAVAQTAVEILSVIPARILDALQPGKTLTMYITSIAVSGNLSAMSSPNYPNCEFLVGAKRLLSVLCPDNAAELEAAILALKAVEVIVDGDKILIFLQ